MYILYMYICICIYVYKEREKERDDIYVMLNQLIKLLGFIHLLVDQPFYLSEIMNF